VGDAKLLAARSSIVGMDLLRSLIHEPEENLQGKKAGSELQFQHAFSQTYLCEAAIAASSSGLHLKEDPDNATLNRCSSLSTEERRWS